MMCLLVSLYVQTCAQQQAMHGSWTECACQRQTARQMMLRALLFRRHTHHFSLLLFAVLRCRLGQGEITCPVCTARPAGVRMQARSGGAGAATGLCATRCRHKVAGTIRPARSGTEATSVLQSEGANAGAVRGSHFTVCLLCRHEDAGAVGPVCIGEGGATASRHTAGAGPGSHEPMAGSCQGAGATALQSWTWPGPAWCHSGVAGPG